jgi:phage tail sheath gpL-like
MISFNTIPSVWREPGNFIEIDNSRAITGLNLFQTRLLIITPRLSSGTVPEKTLTLVNSSEEGKKFIGQGSVGANMIKAIKDNGYNVQCYFISLDDDSDGTAATGTITVSGTATENGTIFLYVGGKLVQAAVKKGDTAATIASAINAAINANADLPVTSGVSTSTVTVTFRHKGTLGNQLDLRLNYYGREGGQQTPAGITVTLPVTGFLTGGATDPVVQDAIDVLPDEIYDYIVTPFTDATNLGALETELADRWTGMRMLEGHAFCAKVGTVSALTTFGTGRNSPHVTVMGFYDSPTPTWEWASAVASQVAFRASQDPARPYNDLSLVNVLAPPPLSRFTLQERNGLLFDGVSTFTVDRAGMVWLSRIITMYQTSNVDTPDPSYLDFTTMATLAYLRQDLRVFENLTYRGFSIVDDGTRIPEGKKITSPKLVRADIIGRSLLWEAAGLIEDVDQFANDLIVERNTSDRNRLDILLPPNLVNPLYVIANQIQFRL